MVRDRVGSGVGAPNRREAAAIAAVFFASSALGFAFLAVMARWLSPSQNASFLALWGLVFAFGSVVGAVEQEITRQAAHATLEGGRVPVGAVQTILVTSVGVHVVLSVLMLTAAGRTLTVGSVAVALLTFLALSGFSIQILSRGVFLGRHSLGSYLTVLAGEAVVRMAVGLVLVASDLDGSVQWAAVALVTGCFSWLPVVTKLRSAIDWHSSWTPWRRVTGRVSALATANGLSALVLTGFPALATVAVGRAHELSDLFAVVTLSRVPLVLLAPVQAMTVPVVIRWIWAGRMDLLRRSLFSIVAGSLVAAAAAAALGYALGPWATGAFMGGRYQPSGLTCALVLAATCVLAGALLEAAVLVALERSWLLAGAWFVAVVAAILPMLLLPDSAGTRALSGFVVGPFVAQLTIGAAVLWTVTSLPATQRPT